MSDVGYEYQWTGPHKTVFGVQTADGHTAEAEPGGRVLLAEPVTVDGLEPVNEAAIAAADRHDEAVEADLPDRVGDMKVADVLPLLDALGPVELAEVRDAEAAGTDRVTILARIDELLAADTVPPASAGDVEVTV